MDRLTFLGALATGLLAAPLVAGAQQAGKQSHVGYLSPVSAGSPGHVVLRQSLQEFGYVEGRNIIFDDRFADGHGDRLSALAEDLTRQQPDVIVAASPPAIRAARAATGTIPIIMITGDDPVRSGFVASLAHPGGNITGVTFLVVDLYGKQMELLKEVLPGLKRVALLWDPTMPTAREDLVVTRTAARALNLAMYVVEVRGSGGYDDAFTAMKRERTGAFIVAGSPTFNRDRDRIVSLAARHSLPGAWGFKEDAQAGGLLSYGTSQSVVIRLAATYVVKILKGARPGDLPIEQPTTFELVINLKTAKALGLTIPQSLLQRADQVIE